MTEPEPEVRKQLLKSARLWTLSLICASVGAATVWATGSVGSGVLAFLSSLLILGPILWFYQKRH